LPPKETKTVSVGGYGCPLEDIPTMDFLRALTPMFSYITAWAHSGRHRLEKNEYSIDNFSSKHTTAWRDLTNHLVPKIFPRGDECNEFISVADMVAYLTEKKLWDQKLWLEPENVKEVWDDYDFYVEPRFLDKNVQSKIRWYSKQEISTIRYLARPMIFMDVERITISELGGGTLASAAAYVVPKVELFRGLIDILTQKRLEMVMFMYTLEEKPRRGLPPSKICLILKFIQSKNLGQEPKLS